MNTQDIKYFSFPLPENTHRQLKVVVSANGLTFRDLFAELVQGYLNQEKNQKILAVLK